MLVRGEARAHGRDERGLVSIIIIIIIIIIIWEETLVSGRSAVVQRGAL